MSARPSFQFYPADWRTNANLLACTLTEQGAWMHCLCLFHESDEYGVMRVPLKTFAKMLKIFVPTLQHLADKNVLKGADKNFEGFYHTPRHAGCAGEPVLLIPPCAGSCWYSSRMVIDEWRRNQRGASTRFSAENNPSTRHPAVHPPVRLVKPPAVHPPDGLVPRLGDGSTTSSSVQEDSERESLVDRVVPGETKNGPRLGDPQSVQAVNKKHGTRWPTNAAVPRGWIEAASAKRHDLGLNDLDLAVEAEMFANYWTGKAGKDATKLDWFKTWTNWALKANGKMNGHAKSSPHADLMASGLRAVELMRQRENAAAAPPLKEIKHGN